MSFFRGKLPHGIKFRWVNILAFVAILLSSIISPSKQVVQAKPLSVPNAAVSLGIPSSVMLGEDFEFTVSFENNGTDPGYGPFIDLVFPVTGQDGNDGITYDLILRSTYLGSSLEDDVQTFPDDGGGSGCISHPWLRDTAGNYVDVCGVAGDQFVSIRLPFGSYVPGQPRLDITVNAHLSNLADLTPDLLIYARGGYMFGATPEDDWCCGDAPFAVPNGTDSTTWPSSPVTPQIMTFAKEYTGPGNTEDETATGPNFPRKYTLTVTIADGQTLTGIDVQDLLPDNAQFIGIDTGNTTAGYSVNSLPSTADTGGTLSLRYASFTGTIVVTYDFYIPELFDLPNPPDDDALFDDPVIDPTSGDDVSSDNISWVDAFWNPLDPRDNPTPITTDSTCPTCPPLHTLIDKSIAIQKSVNVVPGTGGGPSNNQAAPGAILEYSIEIQVSDYFSFDDLIITDTISDGQHVLDASSFVPTLAITGNPSNYSNNFASANYAVVCDYTQDLLVPANDGSECNSFTTQPPAHSGGTTLTFNLSDELGGNGRLVGGCVNPAGGMVTSCDHNPTGDSGAGPTTAIIIFRTQILDEFVDDYPSGDISVDQGDELGNLVDVTGDVLDNSTFSVLSSESDNATANSVIGRYTLAKTIYAINDNTLPSSWPKDSLGRIRINPGDKITYRLTYDLLTSDVEELTFDDYFPLPVFDVTDPDDNGAAGPSWSFLNAVAIPDPGVVSLGPSDTFYNYMSVGLAGTTGVLSPSTNNTIPTQDPVITSNGADNKINVYFADYDDTRNLSTTVDLLFSLIVSSDPFADGLFLTNMAHTFEGSTNAGTSSDDAIIQFVLGEPVLTSTKGVVWTSNGNVNAVFTPTQVGPGGVNFQNPASSPRWTGLINSTGLDANPIDSNLAGVDAGDTVTFAITIENQGSSLIGAFDIQLRDILDSDYYIDPATGADLNLQVYYGDGTGPIDYQSVELSGVNPLCTATGNADDCGLELFDQGIELIDPGSAGVCSAHDPNLGNNVILITYDLLLRPDVIPGEALNTATVFNFSGSEGGPNHLDGVNPLEDDSTVEMIGGLEKTLDETEINISTQPTGTNLTDEVVIGELVYYTISAIIPEGQVPNARLEDQLDGGLAFVSCDSISVMADTGVITDLAPADFSGVCSVVESSGVTNNGQDIVFELGNITNNDRDDNLERISITYTVVVINAVGNQNTLPTLLNNQAEFLMNNGSGDISLDTVSAPEVTVIEPQVVTEKFTPMGTTSTSTSGDAGDVVSYTITLSNGVDAADTDAFDLNFVDNFPMCPGSGPSAVEDMVIISQSGAATFTLSGDNVIGWSLSASGFDLAPGESTTVDISGTIDYCVTPGLAMENRATTTWTNLSGDFSSSPRSTYNTEAVERTGEDGVGGLNDYTSEAVATVNIDNPENTKYIITTSEDFTGLVSLIENTAIGEIVRYRIISAIPEGTSPNFQVLDLIPAGMVFLNDGTSVAAFVSDGGVSSSQNGTLPIPAVPAICHQAGSTADMTTPILDPTNCTLADNNVSLIPSTSLDGDDNFLVPGQDVYFKLGNLVNNDSDPDTEYVVIEFNTLVHNSATNQNDAGDILTNQHRVYINGSPNGDSVSGVDIRIAEPVIEVVKSVITAPHDADDPIEYQIIFRNASTGDHSATAFDLELTDTFDAYLENLAIFSVSTTQGAVCTGDGSGVTVFSHSENLAAGVFTAALSCLDPGNDITVRITGNVVDNVPAGTIIQNSAVGTGTSLEGNTGTTGNGTGSDTTGAPGSDTGERDGSDTDTGGQNDHYDVGDADYNLAIPEIDKYVEAPTEFTIGEEFTYDLVVTLPDGTTPDLVVEDDIPVGLEVLSYNLITTSGAGGSRLAADFDGTLPAPIVTMVGSSGGDITFDFGDTSVVAEYPNDPDNNSFQIQIEVRMLNVIGNQHGDTLTNSAEVQYSSGSAVTNTVDVLVIEPLLQIQKSVDDDTPALGQTITYELHIINPPGIPVGSWVDAHNVVIVDTLPIGVSNPTNVVSSGIPGSCGSLTSYTYNVPTNELSIYLNVIELGCDLRVRYDADVETTPAVGSTLTNDVLMTWTSLIGPSTYERTGSDGVGGLNDYEAATSEDLVITNPDLRIDKDDGVTAYIPGTSLTYTIVVENVGNEEALNAEVTDIRPSQISTWTWSCIGATNGATGCTPAASSSNDFSDFINLPANSSITYQVVAVIPSSATGILTNTAEVIMPAGQIEPTPADNIDDDIDGQDSHADLTVNKDDGVTIISPAITLTYTVVAENISPSDVAGATVTDPIPADIDSWSWTCTGATGSASGCTGTGGSSTSDFSDVINLPANSTITYTVTAVVSSTASGTLTNEVTIAVPIGVTDDDLTNNTDDDIDVFASNAKNLVSLLHGVTTTPNVAIGEILIYEVTLTVPPGSMTNTHLVDTLDRGLAFVSCESITPGTITTTVAGGYASICSNPTVSTLPPNATEDDGRQVDFDFDTLANPGGAPVDLVIRYRVAVLDSLANQSGSTPLLVNDAEWVWDSGLLSDQAVGVNILEPDLTLAKDAFPTVLYPGQLTTFTLTVEHTPGSQTSAFDVEIEDIIPDDLIFQSAVHVGGQAPTAIITTGDPSIIIEWDEFLDNGVNSEIEIVVMLDPTFNRRKVNQTIVNEASLAWTSLPLDYSAPQSIHNTLSTERFYDPLSNINIYGLGDDARIRIPALPDTGFAPGTVTDIPIQKESQEYSDLDGLRVEISKLGVSVPIVSVPLSENGWDLTWLWNQAGWLEGTAYPSWYGNTVITGHAYLPSGFPGPFVNLGDLSWGDEIILYAHGLKYTYEVRFMDLVAADDYSILQHKNQDWLTLFTCKDYSDLTGAYLWRQAVQAVLIDVEQIEK